MSFLYLKLSQAYYHHQLKFPVLYHDGKAQPDMIQAHLSGLVSCCPIRHCSTVTLFFFQYLSHTKLSPASQPLQVFFLRPECLLSCPLCGELILEFRSQLSFLSSEKPSLTTYVSHAYLLHQLITICIHYLFTCLYLNQ